MKKIFSIIAIALVFALSVPSIPSYAADNTQFIIRCRTTVPEETTGNGGVLYASVFPDGQSSGDAMRQHIIEGLATFDFSQLQGYDYYFVGANRTSGTGDNPATGNIFVFWFNSSAVPLYTTGNSLSSTVSNSFYASIGSTFKVQSLYVTTSGYGSWSTVDTLTTQNNLNNSVYGACTAVQYVLDCNFAVNSEAEIVIKSGIVGSWGSNDVKQWYFNGGYQECTDLFANTQGYNAQGEIVDGSGDPEPEYESNTNHMFFKDCEIGFCYPKSSPSPVSFGGAYFYIKYTVDDWIVNHISDYSLVFYADAEVGNEVTNTIRYEIALDPDGCITIPFSRVWTTPLTSKGFSVLVTDREIEDNFYKAYLYSLSPSGFVNFGAKAAASNQNSISGALNALISGGIQSFLYYINGDQIDFYSAMSEIGTSIATKYNPYLITAFTLLTDGTDNSGLFEMQFDLVAGTEDVTDTGGLVNPDPFIPEDDPDFTPPAPTPGNSTTPGYNIVPSGYWQGTINGVIGYDPGYRDLKSDLDKDPDGNFTQYLDPMKNQTVGSWFLSFVNDMPSEMKALLITGTGVGIFFGIYRFIRRG